MDDNNQNPAKDSPTTTQSDQGDNSGYQSPYMKLDQANSPSAPPPPKPQGQNKTGNTPNEGQNTPSTNQQGQVPVQGGGFENFISQGASKTTPQTTSSGPSKKSATGKYIATILGIILLVGGVGAGVFLVQRNQELRRLASSAAECDQSTNCVVLEDPGDSGTFQVEGIIYNVFLTAQQAHSFDESVEDNGCYRVDIEGDTVNWERYGDGPDCQEISNIQIWTSGGGTVEPSLTAQCLDVRIYDTAWNQLTTEQLSGLQPGDTIRLAVSGSTSDGNLDQARFIINGEVQEPTTTVRSETGEFYQEYTVPEGVQSFSVNAELHHDSAGWF